MAVNQSLFFDLSDKIQHFLSTAYCKGRDHQTAASVKGPLDDLCQYCRIIRTFSMTAVSVGRFHHNIICLSDIYRIPDQRLINISDIAGKNDLFCFVLFRHPDFNTAGAKKMSCIHKSYFDSLCRFDDLIIWASDEVPEHTHGIFHSVCRNKFRFSFSPPLSVSPLSLEHLDMCAVTKHDIAEITSCLCRIDRPLIAFCIQGRKISGMIHVCMCQKHKIQITRSHRKLLIFIIIRSLLHSIIHQKLPSCRFQIITASSHLMRSTDKCYLHAQAPFSVPRSEISISKKA